MILKKATDDNSLNKAFHQYQIIKVEIMKMKRMLTMRLLCLHEFDPNYLKIPF